MNRFFMMAFVAMVAFSPQIADAAIMKLGFSTDSEPDIEMVGGVLSTHADISSETVGDQQTEVTLLDVLSGLYFVEGDRASFTLDGVVLNGKPAVVGSTVLQPTAGGEFWLYGPGGAAELLLQGTLGAGTLSGPIGSTATGGFLTTEFGTFTDGLLLPALQGELLTRSSFSISMTDVNGGVGMTLDGDGNLVPFTGDATANISASGPTVPEPAGTTLALTATFVTLGLVGRRRR